MTGPNTAEVTRWLDEMAAGDDSAADRLLPAVYDELHRLAERYFRDQPNVITLQPTALVHEVYLKLADQSVESFETRAHFMAVAAKAMRHILIDRSRRRAAVKHGGGVQRVTLHDEAVGDRAETDDVDLVELDAAIRTLAEMDERKSRIVELRFFGGLSIEETAAALGIARSTVTEDWRLARAWLAAELRDTAGE